MAKKPKKGSSSTALERTAQVTPSIRTLQIDPPTLMCFLKPPQKDREVVLLDFEPDQVGKDGLRLALNVAFKAVRFRSEGNRVPLDLTLGCTNADVFARVSGGKVTQQTAGQAIPVKYTATSTSKRESSIALKPVVKSKAKGKEIEISPGEVQLSKGDERTHEAETEGIEYPLAPVQTGDTTTWYLDLPRVQHLVRDYLVGNLWLTAEFDGLKAPISGEIGVVPRRVRVFDSNGPLSFSKTVAIMMYLHGPAARKALKRANVRLESMDEIRVAFAEVMNG